MTPRWPEPEPKPSPWAFRPVDPHRSPWLQPAKLNAHVATSRVVAYGPGIVHAANPKPRR